VSRPVWALAAAYVLVGVGLFYSLWVGSDELFLAVTAVVYVLLLPLAYLVYTNRTRGE